MKTVEIILYLKIVVLLTSCAKQTTPSGGPKDEIPPILVGANPPNLTTEFKENTIELTFDEYIIVNNPREQVIVTPSLSEPLEIKARKKSVIIELPPSPLEDSTTYTINFREGIQDITEKNPVQNLQYVLSTGTYLDSLTITGTVYDAIKSLPYKGATVALYFNADTFNIFKHKPSYFTKANEKGAFAIQNLKTGTYYIYAFDDANKNLTTDSKSEMYGFQKEPITLTPENQPNIKIPLIKLDSRDLQITNARKSNTFFNIKMSKGLTSYAIEPTNQENAVITTYGEDRANIRIYPIEVNGDSIQVKLQAQDSISFTVDSLLYIQFSERTNVKPERFTLTAEKPKVFVANELFEATFNMSKPVTYVNFDSIVLKIDTLHTIEFTEQNISWNYPQKQFMLTKLVDKSLFTTDVTTDQQAMSATDLQRGASTATRHTYTLNIGKGAFISLEGDSSTVLTETVTIYKPENTSIVTLRIETEEPNFIVELLNKDFKVIQSSYNQHQVTFTNIIPGDYQIRLVIDTNENKVWDAGNYYKRIEPEDLRYYRSEKDLQLINIKANWELGPLLISY